jgi:tetratricopeptide (TPR) repeat protein
MVLSQPRLDAHYQAVYEALYQIGDSYFIAGQLDDALHIFAAGYTLTRTTTTPSVSYTSLVLRYGALLAWQGSLITGEYDQALVVLQRAVALAATLDDPITYARALDALGLGYYQQASTSAAGNFTPALDYFQQALTLRETVDDRQGWCESYFHLGLIAERERRFDDAVAIFTTAYQQAQQAGFLGEQASAIRHLGFAHMRAGRVDAALEAFQEGLSLTERSGSRLFLPFAQLSVGEVFHAQRAYVQAERHYREAQALAEMMQIKRATVQIVASLGELAADQHNLAQAQAYYEAALATAEAINFTLGVNHIRTQLQALDHGIADAPAVSS